MSDATPAPEPTDHPAEEPAPVQPSPARASWWRRQTWWRGRTPWLIAAVALLLGCCLGGGIVAVGALAFGGGHGDDRGHSGRSERGEGRGGPGRGDHRDRSVPVPGTPAPSATSAAPSPAAS